jgi:hypothetical protein
MFHEEFKQEAGMNIEFTQMFQLLGWTYFYNTTERGCRLLTIEFMCTLTPTDDGVTFRLFYQEHTLSWRRLSNALGFAPGCILDIDTTLEDFDKLHFWANISGRQTYIDHTLMIFITPLSVSFKSG